MSTNTLASVIIVIFMAPFKGDILLSPISKKHYNWTVNTAMLAVVAAALFSDRYPQWRYPLLAVAGAATLACVWVYFRHRFDVLAGRATDDDLDESPPNNESA